MSVCAFFGHRDANRNIEPALREMLVRLIEERGVSVFYVGNQGAFDQMVANILSNFKRNYSHIRCYIVCAYYPTIQRELYGCETVYPEGLEFIPRKYAIDHRNSWMLSQSDYVVTHVKASTGGAAKFKKLAEKKGKTVINIV